jgi:hypothetical protein
LANHSIYVKADGYSKVGLRDANAVSGMYAAFDLSTASVIESASSINAAIDDVGGGWFRISAAFTTPAAQRFSVHVLPPSYTSGIIDGIWTGDGVSGVYIWGAQLELGSTATDYQKVTNQYTVTEAGVPSCWSLKYDLIDDDMVTTFPAELGTDCTIGTAANPASTVVGAQTVGTTYTQNTDNYGLVITDDALTTEETAQLTDWLDAKAGN